MKYPQPPIALSARTPDIPIVLMNNQASSVVRRTRYKLWELQSCWHCMVIGTCLKISDVSQAAVKASISIHGESEYDLHQLAVESAANKSHPLSQQLQKQLERRYASNIKRYRAAKDPSALAKLWAEDWSTGHVAGALWALITNPVVTRDVIMNVFGEVHMMSHLSGANVCIDRKRLISQERELKALTQDLSVMKSRFDKVNGLLVEHRQLLESEQGKVRALNVRLEQVQNERAKRPSLPRVKSAYPEGLVERLRDTIGGLQHELGDQQVTNRKYELEIERLERQLNSQMQNGSPETEQTLKLCGQCVLYLGGKAQQRRHFQALVESCEGRFLHHDGGLEACPHRIAELVTQADVVMCPADCISHGAMEKARSLCAKKDIPIIFMRRASLSNFTRSLHQALG